MPCSRTSAATSPDTRRAIRKRHDCLTWVVLKGHTNNRGGSVTITSPDPRVRPAIDFRYFEEGTDAGGDDLQAVVDGIRLVRRMTAGMKPELDRGRGTARRRRDERRRPEDSSSAITRGGITRRAPAPIGPEASGGVLTSDFKVHRTEGLRVVDASVFPRAPGLFIVSAIYMIGEKAADAIIADAKGLRSSCRPQADQ